MLRAFDATVRCVDQGSNKHLVAFAIYLKPWNSDIFEFIDLQLIFRCGGPTDSKAEANAHGTAVAKPPTLPNQKV